MMIGLGVLIFIIVAIIIGVAVNQEGKD